MDEGIEIRQGSRLLVWLEESTDKYDKYVTLPTAAELLNECQRILSSGLEGLRYEHYTD